MDGVFDSTLVRVGAVVVASVAALGIAGYLKNYVNSASTQPSTSTSTSLFDLYYMI